MSDIRILIVEDERIVARDIERRLMSLGYSVTAIVSSGEEAIENAERTRPDLILMDIRLKGKMDGIEAAEDIRKRQDIPIVYLTAYGSEETIERAKITGPFGYLLKPFEDRELRTAIDIALFRHNMELTLRESEARYRQLFEESRDALYVVDLKGNLSNVNRSFQNLFGYGKEDVIRTREMFLDHGELRRLARELEENNIIVDHETRLLKKDGSAIDCLVSLSQLFDKEGRLTSYQGSIHDITRRRQLETQLFQAKKMEAIGKFAGTVAHDFNNLMTTISGYAELLQLRLQQKDLKRYIDGIVKSCSMAAQLTKDLLSFSRDKLANPKKVDIGDVLKKLENVMVPVIGNTVAMDIVTEDKDLTVYADESQLGQVFLNLVTNARDAMPHGGSITIRAEKADMNAVSGRGDKRNDEWVVISVQDTGEGMDKETLERIFEPFFSTKEAGKGTGLGLSIVYGIIKQHRGHIDVLSELGKGTVFRIWLPLVRGEGTEGLKRL
ncbi:MAG TPA: ATP-binding protein [Syntrophorhabdaceae bacterium]|nr:ATP-binding protein [Syntrophorhabdaceae bacterium]